ncbi:MAG: Transport ATP-binding protein CydD, partial [Labilithrix sp.]|nr:Transport ATP-binding protein CydD [Labilithrix sp.]
TALVGPSGAGKTTLVRLVPRLWETTSGAVVLGGVEVRALPLDVLLSRISMVFQDVFLFHGTIRENLRLARPDATDEHIDAACRAARAYDFIQALPEKYDTMLGERGARLSGGEKQRLSIARALLKDAPVLLLDEATAFADPENEARIQEALSELCEGRTVLVVAHRLSTIATADHIVVIDGGRVNDQGTHDELLLRCPLYQRLWKSHTEALEWSLDGTCGEPRVAAVAVEVA